MDTVNLCISLIIIIELLLIGIYANELIIKQHTLQTFYMIQHQYYHDYIYFMLPFYIAGFLILCYFFELNVFLFLIFCILTIFIQIEMILRNNSLLTDKEIRINDLYNQCKTGDFILYDLPFKMNGYEQMIPTYYFGMYHIGIIISINGEKYSLECDYKTNYCHYSKRFKNGVILYKLKDRLDSCFTDIYYIKTNTHGHIQNSNMIPFIEKYHDLGYMEKKMNCVVLYLAFLQEYNLIRKNYFILPLYVSYDELLNESFYKFPFKREIYKLEKCLK